MKTIFTTLLAVLVLLSSSSFVVGIHLCSGHVRDVNVFAPAQPCEKEQQLPPCHRLMKKSCCEDETIVHEGDDLKPGIPLPRLVLPAGVAVVSVPLILAEIIPALPSSGTCYVQYDPPLRWYDITIAHRVLLI